MFAGCNWIGKGKATHHSIASPRLRMSLLLLKLDGVFPFLHGIAVFDAREIADQLAIVVYHPTSGPIAHPGDVLYYPA